MSLKHIVSFSGGKDSTAMLLLMIEKGWQIDEIIFCDTGMEFPAMYKHIERVKNYIGREIKVVKSEKSFEYYMFDHVRVKGSRIGKKGYGWPDFRNRWCTSRLKIEPFINFLKRYDKVTEYHGIALDEIHRTENNKGRNIRYPLIELQMTEKDALNYCYSKGFNWDGLYKKFHRVSCWCCPLQSISELRQLYTYFPELWKKLKKMDERAWNQFRSDYSVSRLEKRFYFESRQLTLFGAHSKETATTLRPI